MVYCLTTQVVNVLSQANVSKHINICMTTEIVSVGGTALWSWDLIWTVSYQNLNQIHQWKLCFSRFDWILIKQKTECRLYPKRIFSFVNSESINSGCVEIIISAPVEQRIRTYDTVGEVLTEWGYLITYPHTCCLLLFYNTFWYMSNGFITFNANGHVVGLRSPLLAMDCGRRWADGMVT